MNDCMPTDIGYICVCGCKPKRCGYVINFVLIGNMFIEVVRIENPSGFFYALLMS